jgi:hypothetical protein
VFRRRRGQIRLALSEEESDLLRATIGEYLELLDAERDRSDPVIARLFPSASLDDPALDASYQQLAASDLDDHKRATARRALLSLDGDRHDALGEEELEAWLVLLTDLRLAIGVRMGVTEETMERLPNPGDPAQWPLAVLHYLASLQETLVQALQG